MSLRVLNGIAASLGRLVRKNKVPTGPLGFGTDLSLVTDITRTLEEVDPFTVRGITEAIIRRLTCPRGRCPGAPNHGIDVRSYCNRGMTFDDLRAVEGDIATELLKDDRIATLDVRVIMGQLGKSLDIRISVVAEDPNIGSFDLTLAVTSAEVVLEAIAA